MPTFLMTHHSFTTSAILMDQLFKRYHISPPPGLNQRMFEIFVDKKVVQVRLKVCHILLYWIQNHFEDDFVDNEYLILRFRDFIGKKVIHDFEQMAVQILNELEQKLQDQEQSKSRPKHLIEKKESVNFPKPLLASIKFGVDPIAVLLTDSKAFFEIDPLEMARQLSIVEHDLYCKVQAYECTDQIWESHYRKEVAQSKQTKPAVCKRHSPGSPSSDISNLIQHTNEFTFWVATCIINNESLKGRVNAVKYFVQMAQVYFSNSALSRA
jgi:son of sevenless